MTSALGSPLAGTTEPSRYGAPPCLGSSTRRAMARRTGRSRVNQTSGRAPSGRVGSGEVTPPVSSGPGTRRRPPRGQEHGEWWSGPVRSSGHDDLLPDPQGAEDRRGVAGAAVAGG